MSTISRGMTVVGKIVGEGTVHVLGQVEGELRALTVLINEGAKVEGEVAGGGVDNRRIGQGDHSRKPR